MTPDVGWHIAGINDNGNPVTATNPSGMTYTLEDVVGNHLVEVTFKLNTYTVAASADAAGGGMVSGPAPTPTGSR